MFAMLTFPSTGPPWNRTSCLPPQRLMVHVPWPCPPPPLPLPDRIPLLHWGPIAPEYLGKFPYVDFTVVANHGTKSNSLRIVHCDCEK